jgi:hypothetical protein
LWNFYKKELLEEQSNPQAPSGGAFLVLPQIPNTPQNLKTIDEIGEIAEEFVVNVGLATRQKCWCFCWYTKMFGTLEQNMLLL